MNNKITISINNRFNELSERAKIEITHLINSIASHKYNDYVQKNTMLEIDKLYTKIHDFYIKDYQKKLLEKRKNRKANKKEKYLWTHFL